MCTVSLTHTTNFVAGPSAHLRFCLLARSLDIPCAIGQAANRSNKESVGWQCGCSLSGRISSFVGLKPCLYMEDLLNHVVANKLPFLLFKPVHVTMMFGTILHQTTRTEFAPDFTITLLCRAGFQVLRLTLLRSRRRVVTGSK